MNDKPTCIELSNISFQWPQTQSPLISIEHLSIDYGEHLFIQGASGSGKSTFLNLLTGVLTPTTGIISILNQRLDSLAHYQRDQFRADHFGVIFQQFNLIPYLNVLENVALPLSFSAYKHKRAELLNSDTSKQALRILEALGISSELANQNVTQLSTGQQQRVAAARALIGTPEIIIADEPTSSLDEDAKHDFINLLFKEAEKFNSTLVFVSHDKSLASNFSRTMHINDYNNLT